VCFSLKQFVFRFLFRDARDVMRYHLCSTFSLEKKSIFTLFYYFVDPHRLKKNSVDALKEFILFHLVIFWLNKRRTQTFCCKGKIVFVKMYRA